MDRRSVYVVALSALSSPALEVNLRPHLLWCPLRRFQLHTQNIHSLPTNTKEKHEDQERREHMSEKECSHHKDKRRKRLRRFFGGLLILIFIILIIVLLIWAILQPKKPRFVLQDATVYAFNVTAPNFLTSTILVTIASRNPNDKIGVYYDKLDIFAIYQNQQITYYTAIPSTYQGHKEINVWSPIVSGVNVPVAPYNGVGLSQDQADGTVILTIKIQGRVRFKVGTFVSGHYHLTVNCPANIVFGNPTPGIVVGSNGIKYQLDRSCSVSL